MLTKKELARLSGVSQQTLTRYEDLDNDPNPSSESIESLSRVLGFPVGFFFLSDIEKASAEFTSFRSLKSMTAAIRDAALAAGAIGFEISDWVENRFNLPKINVPDLSEHSSSPEVAARILREVWGLGEQPISNVLHLLESKGVRVFSLCENTHKVNAYSLWRKGKPYVFLNTQKSAECSRFDAAHEVAHLVLHQDGNTRGRAAEEQANSFASAFLMPESDLLAKAYRIYSINHLIDLKSRWKVSLMALCYRLHKVGLLTDWKYREHCIRITQNGFNRSEPNAINREQSVVWNKVLNALWSDQQTHYDIPSELHLPIDEIEGLVFGILSRENVPFPLKSDGPPLRLISG